MNGYINGKISVVAKTIIMKEVGAGNKVGNCQEIIPVDLVKYYA